MDNCVIVEPITVPSTRRKAPTKRKPPAKRKTRVSTKRKKGTEDAETVEDIKIEINATSLNDSVAETSVDELKPILDPVTGEIVTPAAVDSQEDKPNRKRDRTKVKKEKKPYVRK